MCRMSALFKRTLEDGMEVNEMSCPIRVRWRFCGVFDGASLRRRDETAAVDKMNEIT